MKTKPTKSPATIARWLGVAAGPLVLAAGFLWAGGWLSPHRITQNSFMTALHNAGNPGHGTRRAHAKGVCVTGWFDASNQAASLSTAAVFRRQHIPVVGRFALGVMQPDVADSPDAVRSLALRFMPPHEAEWRTGMNDPPVQPSRDARDAYDFFTAMRLDPATRKPDPAKLLAFVKSHPWLQKAIVLDQHRFISSGFADDTYNSLDSFLLIGPDGKKTPVRWSMVPSQPVTSARDRTPGSDRNYLFHDLISELHEHALQWHLILTVAGPSDAVDDPSQLWSEEDRRIDAGTLVLTRAESEDGGPCTGISFDPLVLPPGIAPSGDELLKVRSSAYMRSFYLRSGEDKAPSAVTPAMIDKGRSS